MHCVAPVTSPPANLPSPSLAGTRYILVQCDRFGSDRGRPSLRFEVWMGRRRRKGASRSHGNEDDRPGDLCSGAVAGGGLCRRADAADCGPNCSLRFGSGAAFRERTRRTPVDRKRAFFTDGGVGGRSLLRPLRQERRAGRGLEYDPWEPFNTKVFEFNRQVDKWILKPVAQGYDAVVPNPVQIGISNLFYNIRFPSRFINNLAQGKLAGAGTEVGRFLLNSTFGLAGLVDVAKYLDITTPEEDTGQTLGYYGVGPGPYVVLPLLPPFTVRDLIGYVGDIALNPINWMVFPIIEVDGIPSLVAHHNRTTSSIAQIGGRVEEVLNERSLNLEKFQGVEEATLDLYTAVKNAYIQKRRNAIRD